MIRVGVIGSTGYAGAELVRLLAGHPDVKLAMLTSRQFAGERFDRIYPAMAGVVNLTCESYLPDKICARSDVVFTALPHKLPMAIVPELIKRGKRVIDLSADFRFQDAETYETHYQPHTARDLLKTAVYGLCEVNAHQIKTAFLIGNPGCYPTSALLSLIPLIKKNLLDIDTIVIDSKSGVSGAGRSLSLTTHFCEVNESFKAYKVAAHRHNPEIEESLSIAAGESVKVTFVPHLVPMTRGMLTTIYANPARGVDFKKISDTLFAFYSGASFIRICPENRPPDTRHVRGTNYCDIGFKLDGRNNRLILMSAIDNLVKGAAGQAVQNMNIMLGLSETAGLDMVPYPV